MKYILKRSAAKAGIYATLLSVVVASIVDFMAYRSCLKFASLHFNVLGAVSLYFVLEAFNFIGIGVFQVIKNAIEYIATPIPEEEK